jgi:hypothetical protein
MKTCSESFFFFTHDDERKRDKGKNEYEKELKNKMMLQIKDVYKFLSNVSVCVWGGGGVALPRSSLLFCSLFTCNS